jgi:hypothetical protein
MEKGTKNVKVPNFLPPSILTEAWFVSPRNAGKFHAEPSAARDSAVELSRNDSGSDGIFRGAGGDTLAGRGELHPGGSGGVCSISSAGGSAQVLLFTADCTGAGGTPADRVDGVGDDHSVRVSG